MPKPWTEHGQFTPAIKAQVVDDLERMGATKKSVHETLVDCQEHAQMVYRQTVQGFGVPRHMLGRDR